MTATNPASFVFMDESFDEVNRISALTALLVPVEEYQRLRSEFYGVLGWTISPRPGAVAPPPALHGSDFLREYEDQQKLETLDGLVDLVVGNGLRVFRVGYYVTELLRETFTSDPQLLSICWASMQRMLAGVSAEWLLIPIMDRVSPGETRGFSGLVRAADYMREAGVQVSTPNSENILGEVFYSVSEYAAFAQLVDVVSYLRYVSDLAEYGSKLTDFKKELLLRSQRLEPAMAAEYIIALTFNGEPQGPASKVHETSADGPMTTLTTYSVTL